MRRLFTLLIIFVLAISTPGQSAKLTGGKVTGGKFTGAAGGGGGSSTTWLTVTSWAGGTPGGTLTRNDADLWLGAEFTVGGAGISVTDLCRVRATGNASSHNVKIVRVSDNTTVAGPTSVNVSSGTVGDFVCVSISPVALSASTTYVVASLEVNAGDGWYNDLNTTLSATAAATLDFSVYSSDGTTGQTYSHNNVSMAYVPVNFKYQ
jgi:hypothetical protein